jgi:hypothetical protein
MAKISVTYHAPLGDNKTTEMFGHTFHDGKAEHIDDDTPAQKAIVAKLRVNRFFEVSGGEGGTAYVKPTAAEAKAKAEADAQEAKEAKAEANGDKE